MATLTPNLGLTLPAGDENVSRQVINDNMMIIDAAAGNNSSLDAMQEGLTNIVDGDTTDEAIPAGAYAYLKNNTHGLAEGYYQNISGSAFPTSGGTASITTFAPVSTAGILNSLNNNLPGFLGEVITVVSAPALPFTYTATEDCWFFANTSCTDGQGWAIHLGTSTSDPMVFESYGVNNVAGTFSQFIPLKNGQTIYCRANNSKPKYSHYRVFRMLR